MNDFLVIELLIGQITAIAFVPVDEVRTAFKALSEADHSCVTNTLEYFEDNFIGRQYGKAGRRRDPRYDVSMQNTHQRVENNLPRTNNFAEKWHRRFQSNIDACHSNFWKLFADILKREQTH